MRENRRDDEAHREKSNIYEVTLNLMKIHKQMFKLETLFIYTKA